MDKPSIIFSSLTATAAFQAGSIAFMLSYLAGILVVHRSRSIAGRPLMRHGIAALAAALIAGVVGVGIHRATINTATAALHAGPMASVSPEQLHRSIDAKGLAVVEVREPF
jgi:hypothetical protein